MRASALSLLSGSSEGAASVLRTQRRKGHVIFFGLLLACVCPVNFWLHQVFCSISAVDFYHQRLRGGGERETVPTSPPLHAHKQPCCEAQQLHISHGFSSLIWLYCLTGVAPPSDSRGVSLVNEPVWKCASLKGYQKYLVRIARLPCTEGLPWRQLSIWTSFKNQPRQCVFRSLWIMLFLFPFFFFMWSYLDVQKFIQLMSWLQLEDTAPTLNARLPLF